MFQYFHISFVLLIVTRYCIVNNAIQKRCPIVVLRISGVHIGGEMSINGLFRIVSERMSSKESKKNGLHLEIPSILMENRYFPVMLLGGGQGGL